MNMTFISKANFFKRGLTGGLYPARLSARSRGEEIASYLGAVFTTDMNYDRGGIRIHLKPRTLGHVKDGEYVDILDNVTLVHELKARPGIKVIVYSQPYYDFLKTELKNEVILIPHPHINFENTTRIKNHPIAGGMVSKSIPTAYALFNPIKAALAKVGIELKEGFTYETRQDMVDFYKGIDFLVAWYGPENTIYDRFVRYPGKIIHAASFGIPTIAQNVFGYQEMEGYYIPATTDEDIAREAVKLQDEAYYNQWSKKLIDKAKEYHISAIAKLYRKLDETN